MTLVVFTGYSTDEEGQEGGTIVGTRDSSVFRLSGESEGVTKNRFGSSRYEPTVVVGGVTGLGVPPGPGQVREGTRSVSKRFHILTGTVKDEVLEGARGRERPVSGLKNHYQWGPDTCNDRKWSGRCGVKEENPLGRNS